MNRQIYQLDAGTVTEDKVIAFQIADGSTEAEKCTVQDIIDLVPSTGILNVVKVSLSSAELLQIGTTPKVVVPKQGANTFIRPISVNAVVNFNTTAYATNQSLTLYEGAWLPLLNMNNILSASATTYFNYPSLTTINTSSNVLNEDLVVYGGSGNPTGGDSTVDLYVSYIVITL